MPTLHWIGKKAVLNHDREVPFHLFMENAAFSAGSRDTGNMVIQGDNLIALKGLLPFFAGKIDVVFIDPPYNTGEENWIYNDNINDPEIKTWINNVVGKEAEDLSRHDKWLCMMYPRLKLLQRLLAWDGIIAVSIDDNELYNLGFLMNEIFGIKNRLACAPWQSEPSGGKSKTALRTGHEYILIYHNGTDSELSREESSTGELNLSDRIGKYRKGRELLKWGKESLRSDREDMWFPLTTPDGTIVFPYRNDGAEGRWRWGAEGKMKAIIADPSLAHWEKRPYDGGIIVNGQRERWVPYEKIRDAKKSFGWSTWLDSYGFNSDATRELKELFGNKPFDTPKPSSLIEWIVSLHTKQNAIVLDSFAGSGTTAQAVINANSADGGTRKFILIEMLANVAQNIIVPRLKKITNGYIVQDGKNKGHDIPATGNGFKYFELGCPLFDEYGNVFGEVKFADLAKHVYFSETGSPLPDDANLSTPLIGTHNGRAIYLLYNGILKDKNPKNGNVLTREVLACLPKFDGPKVVYGTGCRLSASTLHRERIVFKQVPYELAR